MNNAFWDFAVVSFCVGGLISGLFDGAIQAKYGRKKSIIFNNIGWITGALLIGFSVNLAMFIVGCIFCGLGSFVTPTCVSINNQGSWYNGYMQSICHCHRYLPCFCNRYSSC